MKNKHVLVLAGMMAFSLFAAPQPVAYWKLNEGEGTAVKDSGKLKLDGKVLNVKNTEWGEGRKGGKALYFKGSSTANTRDGGCVRVDNVKQLGLDKSFTLSCWFKPASREKMPRTANYEILSNTVSDRGPGLRITFYYDEIQFRNGDGKQVSLSIRGAAAKFPVARETWHHVAVTVDEKGAKLYLNGVLVGEKAGKNLVGQPYLVFGSYNNGYAYSFIGAISDVKFFQQALTPAEVMAEVKGAEQ